MLSRRLFVTLVGFLLWSVLLLVFGSMWSTTSSAETIVQVTSSRSPSAPGSIRSTVEPRDSPVQVPKVTSRVTEDNEEKSKQVPASAPPRSTGTLATPAPDFVRQLPTTEPRVAPVQLQIKPKEPQLVPGASPETVKSPAPTLLPGTAETRDSPGRAAMEKVPHTASPRSTNADVALPDAPATTNTTYIAATKNNATKNNATIATTKSNATDDSAKGSNTSPHAPRVDDRNDTTSADTTANTTAVTTPAITTVVLATERPRPHSPPAPSSPPARHSSSTRPSTAPPPPRREETGAGERRDGSDHQIQGSGERHQGSEREEVLPVTQSDFDGMGAGGQEHDADEKAKLGNSLPIRNGDRPSPTHENNHASPDDQTVNTADRGRPQTADPNGNRQAPTPRPPPVIIRSREQLMARIKQFNPPNRVFRRPRPHQGPPTASPFSAGSNSCPLFTLPSSFDQNSSNQKKSDQKNSHDTNENSHKKLKHTGKRALVIYSLTHRDQGVVYSAEMDNFAFFAQHGLLPEGFKTALFTQVDYIIQRVLPPVKREMSNCTRGLRSKNVELVSLPRVPCDLCALTRTLQYYGINESNTKYAYVVVVNSGTRGPFFTMSPPSSRSGNSTLPLTWVDSMALGGEGQFNEKTITATASSAAMISHFQTYAFGLSIKALGSMLPLFADTCAQPDKLRCIFAGELMSAVEAFKSGLRIRSLLQHPTRTAGDMAGFDSLLRDSQILSPLTSRVIKPCQMLFVKYGGEAYQRQKFPRPYVDTVVSQTLAQAQVAARVPSAGAGSNVFGRAYLGCIDEVQ